MKNIIQIIAYISFILFVNYKIIWVLFGNPLSYANINAIFYGIGRGSILRGVRDGASAVGYPEAPVLLAAPLPAAPPDLST